MQNNSKAQQTASCVTIKLNQRLFKNSFNKQLSITNLHEMDLSQGCCIIRLH